MGDVPDRSVDAVVASQAFHWFASVDALQEIHRMLKPRAVLGMVWNIEDYNAPQKLWEIYGGWEGEMRDVMWSLEDGQDRFRDMKWKDIFGEQGRSNPISLHAGTLLFGLPIGEETFDFVRWLSKDDAWKAFQTYSQVANLDTTRLAEVEKTFWEAISASDTETDGQGRVAVHGKTYIAWTSSVPDDPLDIGG